MIYFITCLAIGVTMFCIGLFFHYIAKHPDYLEETTVKPATYGDFDSENIQSFINERWWLQYLIRECNSLSEIGNLYWRIEDLEDHYRNTVPDQLLITHIDELFAFHAQCALMLRTKLTSLGQTVS